jgi:hypothetical protein
LTDIAAPPQFAAARDNADRGRNQARIGILARPPHAMTSQRAGRSAAHVAAARLTS